ncbi:MAG: sigma-54-dependent transcriptional regulator [Syntrophobacteraceae bacterium]
MNTVLIVDDDEGLVHFLSRFFSKQDFAVRTCGNGLKALEMVSEEAFDLILLDYKMPEMNGLDTLKEIRRLQVKTPVIVMTAYGTMDTAIETMKLGAYDYLLKPFDRRDLERVAKDALEVNRLMKEVVSFAVPDPKAPLVKNNEIKLIGSHKCMQELFKLIGQVAEKDVTVLITGESGTGKELVARAIYHHSLRKDQAFLAVNCAAIPETLFESELFGHERGAFTGAERTHIGKFERCHAGTLFFDEIGDMPLATQAKVLRVLEYGEFERLGGTQTLYANVRILAATNKNLEEAAARGKFRQDLYWRLKVISIHLPPLRERSEDIPALVEYFATRFSGEYQASIRHVEDRAVERLKTHPWPGNVRELENCIRRAILLSSGDVILEEHLGLKPGRQGSPSMENEDLWEGIEPKMDELISELIRGSGEKIHENLIDLIERTLIQKVLKKCGFNQVKAAQVLGISRNTLRHRMKKFEITHPSNNILQ